VLGWQFFFPAKHVSLGDFSSREQAKSECDWVVVSSVFVASQSNCCFLCSREQIPQVENGLNGRLLHVFSSSRMLLLLLLLLL
jgi:hypothetical protein